MSLEQSLRSAWVSWFGKVGRFLRIFFLVFGFWIALEGFLLEGLEVFESFTRRVFRCAHWSLNQRLSNGA